MRVRPSVVAASVLTLATVSAAASPDVDRSPDAAPGAERDRTWLHPWPVVAPRPAAAAGDVSLAFVSVDQVPEGDMPRDAAYTPDGGAVVVVHRDTDNVTFFDTTTLAPTHTVAVGDFPVDVEVTADGRLAVVPNALDHTVSLVDVATHAVVATVPVTGEQPYRVAVTPDSRFAVVGVINDGAASAFSVIDLDLGVETRTFPSGPQGVIGFFFTPESGQSGNIFTAFALTPDGSTIVLPDRGGDRVRLYDFATGAEVADLATAALPTAVDVSADSALAVVSHEGATRRITVVDVVARTVADEIATTENLTAQVIRLTPDATHAMAAISNNLVFVNLATGVTTATISTGSVGDIVVSSDGQNAFVSNFNARIIDVATQTLVRTIPFGPCVDAAASPVAPRAIALNNRFRENIHFYDIDGASGFLEGAAPSGEPEEGDVPYGVDVTPGGGVAVACNVVSANVCVIDVPGGAVRSYIEVGDRPKEVRVTPDGRWAVVCAMDANAVVIIDLATDEAVATLPIFNRPGRVRIAPDGSEAYVLNVAGTDRISFIVLDGENSAIVAQLPAGQTGSANGPTYTETSGIELSRDGSVLAVCDSFNDQLRLYDVAARTQVAAVPTGDFPLRVAFAPDGTRAYVVNHFSDDVTVVAVEGANSRRLATVPGVARYPITVEVDDAGAYVYVGTRSSGGGADAVRVIDAATNAIVRTLFVADGSPRDSFLSGPDALLYAMTTGGALVTIDAAGPASVVLDTVALSGGPADLAFDDTTKTAVVAQPGPDGVDLVAYAAPECPGDVNADGTVDFGDILAILSAWGPCEACPEDADGSGVVDFADLLIVLSGWGECAASPRG